MSKPKILAFSGSLRRESWNRKLVHVAAEGARAAGAEVTAIELREFPLPVFDEDLEAASGLPPAGRRLKDLFLAHDGLLLGCPEYNSAITAAMKNAIDWVSRPVQGEPPLGCFAGKIAALLAASPGALGGLRGLPMTRVILSNINVTVLPQQFALPRAHEAFNPDGSLRDEKLNAAARGVGEALAGMLLRLRGSKS